MKITNNYTDHKVRKWIYKQVAKFPNLYESMIKGTVFIKDLKYNSIIRNSIEQHYNSKNLPLFTHVFIETISRCNGRCSFCQVNIDADIRKFSLMSEETFLNIIQQLKKLNYQKILYFHRNNEALMDKRVYKFIQIARENLPNANIRLFTNGTLLNVEKFKSLTKYLTMLKINNYNDNLELNEPTKEIVNYCNNDSQYDNKVKISIRRETELLKNRASSYVNRKISFKLKSPCLYPFKQFNICASGKVVLCCNDAWEEEVLGDINHESMLDIWYGDKFKDIREKNIKGRDNIKICSSCDILHVPKTLRKN